ncbi:MAG: hypothetical protein AAB785_01970 [Patescibacteria group bacterium]
MINQQQPPKISSSPAPRKNKIKNKLIIIAAIVIALLIVGLGMKLLNKDEDNGGALDTTETKLATSCYTSIIPKSAIVESNLEDDCAIRVRMPNNKLSFVSVVGIYDSDGLTVKETALSQKSRDDQYFPSAGYKYNSQNITDVSLAGLKAYLFKSIVGDSSFKSYFIELPKNHFYSAKGKKIIGLILGGFDFDSQANEFTKYLNLFIDNLKFK